MQKVMHPECGKVGFYVPSFPVGRGFIPVDAMNKHGMPAALGNRVECESCGKKVDFKTTSEYYDMEPVQ